jgi:hypothetical protein
MANVFFRPPEKVAKCWWLMPVILATQEAEIRRIVVQNQPRQIVLKNLSPKNPSQKRAGGWGWGQGGEMTQDLYVHMNNKRKKKR